MEPSAMTLAVRSELPTGETTEKVRKYEAEVKIVALPPDWISNVPRNRPQSVNARCGDPIDFVSMACHTHAASGFLGRA